MLFAFKLIGSKWLCQGSTELYICFYGKGSAGRIWPAGRSLATPGKADVLTLPYWKLFFDIANFPQKVKSAEF